MYPDVHKRVAYELAIEYIRQNNILQKYSDDIDKAVEEFAVVQNKIYDAMSSHRDKLDKLF